MTAPLEPTLAMRPLDWFPTNEELLAQGSNGRTGFGPDEALRELNQSMVLHGQLQPVGAIDLGAKRRLIYGNRRVAAAWLGGINLLKVLIYPATLTEAQIATINATENMQRVDLSEPDVYRSCKSLMALNPEWDKRQLATHLSKDPSTITRWLCPDELIPEALDAFLDGKFGFAKAYAIAKLAKDQQGGMLALTLNGATRDELERQGRKKRGSAASAVRASKIKIALTNGVTVMVSGDDLTLDEAIEAVKDATKEMVKGRDQGLDARTLVAVCRDKAKAG